MTLYQILCEYFPSCLLLLFQQSHSLSSVRSRARWHGATRAWASILPHRSQSWVVALVHWYAGYSHSWDPVSINTQHTKHIAQILNLNRHARKFSRDTRVRPGNIWDLQKKLEINFKSFLCISKNLFMYVQKIDNANAMLMPEESVDIRMGLKYVQSMLSAWTYVCPSRLDITMGLPPRIISNIHKRVLWVKLWRYSLKFSKLVH